MKQPSWWVPVCVVLWQGAPRTWWGWRAGSSLAACEAACATCHWWPRHLGRSRRRPSTCRRTPHTASTCARAPHRQHCAHTHTHTQTHPHPETIEWCHTPPHTPGHTHANAERLQMMDKERGEIDRKREGVNNSYRTCYTLGAALLPKKNTHTHTHKEK